MAIKKTSREEILNASIKLFKRRGYYNTSMANIAEACGLIKGSIYHHFKSKDEIGLEALKQIHHYFETHIYTIADRRDLSTKEKLEHFVKGVDGYFLESEGGCLLGNLALEVSFEHHEFRKEIQNYFRAWEHALTKILREQYTEAEATTLAREYVALTQGAIMMMNLYDTCDDYLKVGKKLIMLA